MAHVVANKSAEEAQQRDLTQEMLRYQRSEELSKTSSIQEEEIKAFIIHSEDQKKLHSPRPPADPRTRAGTTGVLARRMRAGQPNSTCGTVEEAERRPCPLEGTGPRGPCFHHQGVVLPHSILGNLQDFKCYLETRGEAGSVGKGPETTAGDNPASSSSSSAVRGQADGRARGGGCRLSASRQAHHQGHAHNQNHAHNQSHALRRWSAHMTLRRRQQDSLAESLHRPNDWLLMNRANSFRRVQEQRELLSVALPSIQPGHGHRVGSEFWSLPDRLGDEASGIAATLTRAQRGRREPVVRVGQPRTVRRESGNIVPETRGPASKAWDQSEYLQRQQQQIQPVLKELDLETPVDIERLEVIGCGGPAPHAAGGPKPLHRDGEARDETATGTRDPGRQDEDEDDGDDDGDDDDDDDDTSVMLVPALMFCGQSAHWTGSSSSHQGQLGLRSRVGFEVPIGVTAHSHLLLRNHGNAAIYYTWQRLELPRCWAGLPPAAQQTPATHFYFDSSMGVILPSETQQVGLLFKSDTPGIKCELWQLNTHPVLLGGAAMQVTLRGVALDRDINADHRLVLERDLEKTVMVKVCRSLVSEAVRGVMTPERPGSPAELHIAADQEFLRKNPKLQYAPGPLEALQSLWQSAAPGGGWDLSVETLRQAVLSLPEEDPEPADTHHTLTRDQGLARLNAALLEVPQHPLTSVPITAATVGRQLWRELLDGLADEAAALRRMLGLPETDTWSRPGQDPVTPDLVLEEEVKTEEKGERKGGAKEEHRAGGAKERDDGRGASKAPAKERTTKKEQAGEEVTKAPGGRRAKEPSLDDAGQGAIGHTLCDDSQHNVQPETMHKYRTHLHQKVYVMMDHLVGSLASLLDALGDEDKQDKTFIMTFINERHDDEH